MTETKLSSPKLVAVAFALCAGLVWCDPVLADVGAVAPTSGLLNPYGTLVLDPDGHLDAEDAYRPLRFELGGYIRLRGDAWGGRDLGTLGDPESLGASEDWLESANMRVRFAPVLHFGREASVYLELDAFDNLVLGSTPDGLPRSSTAAAAGGSSTQEPPSTGFNGFRDSIAVKKAYLSLVTPVGLLLAGRMGNNWGLGMVSSAGDDIDDDYDDAVDRIGFVTTIWDHLFSFTYDFNANGPTSATSERRRGQAFDTTDRDDVRTINFGVARMDTPEMVRRYTRAGRTVVNYGVAFSYRWQDMELPGFYYTDNPEDRSWAESELVKRGYEAYLLDAWLKLAIPAGGWLIQFEAEAAYLHGSVDHPDPLANAEANFSLSSDQAGAVARLKVQPASIPLWFQLSAGFASGDPAPGFGVWAETDDNGMVSLPQPGDLDGQQIQLTQDPNGRRDTSIDNFRFHPNFRVDQILWRRIIGTFTDGWYVRGDVKWYPVAPLQLFAGVIYSETLEAMSAPGLARPLGVEMELGARYFSKGGFEARFTYAALVPLDGLRDYYGGRDAETSHLVRGLLAYRF